MFENAAQIHAQHDKPRDFGYLVSKPPSQLHEEYAEAYRLLTGLEIDTKTVQAVLSMHGYVQRAHSAIKDAQPKVVKAKAGVKAEVPELDVEAVVEDLNASLKEAIAAGEAELAEASKPKTRKPRVPSPKQVAETAAALTEAAPAAEVEATEEAKAS